MSGLNYAVVKCGISRYKKGISFFKKFIHHTTILRKNVEKDVLNILTRDQLIDWLCLSD